MVLRPMYLSNAAVMVRSFHPRQLDGLVALYDISDLSKLFEERTGASATTPASVDGVVGTALDLSGNGHHLTATSDAARPLLKSEGGRFWLEFDGVDDYLQTADHDQLDVGTDHFYVGAVAKFNDESDGTIAGKTVLDIGAGRYVLTRFGTLGGLVAFFSTETLSAGDRKAAVADTSTDIRVLEQIIDRTAATTALRIDGSQVAQDGPIPEDDYNTNRPFSVGGYGASGSVPFDGRIYAVALFKNTGDSRVTQWLAGKGGVTV